MSKIKCKTCKLNNFKNINGSTYLFNRKPYKRKGLLYKRKIIFEDSYIAIEIAID